MLKKRDWISTVDSVFNTNPRLFTSETSYPRTQELRALSRFYNIFGESVCIDGPSGAGKTSLALSFISNKNIEFVYVQVTKYLDWKGFCRQIIDPNSGAAETSLGADIEFGTQNLMPLAKLKVSLGSKSNALSDEKYITELSTNWTEVDIAKNMAEKNVSLIVDDLERANEEILTRVSDLCKYLLVIGKKSPKTKCILVGTGDIYRRILSANEALALRLNEVSIGSFEEPNDSWGFLAKGFNALKLTHPGNSKFRSQKRLLEECMEYVYEAANGLPKSLNKLGQLIAQNSKYSVSAAEIMKQSDTMIRDNWDSYSDEYPDLVELMKPSAETKEVVRFLYEAGSCLVQKKNVVVRAVMNSMEEKQIKTTKKEIDEAITKLKRLPFIVLTGMKGKEVIFPSDSIAMHTFGVVLHNVKRFPEAADILGDLNFGYQLKLPFPKHAQSSFD